MPGQIKHVFNTDSELDKAIRNGNYDMLSSQEAQARIEATRKAFTDKLSTGAIYMPGQTTLALAAMSPGNMLLPYAQDVLKSQINSFGLSTILKDSEIATNIKAQNIAGGRTPSNLGEITELLNVLRVERQNGESEENYKARISRAEDWGKLLEEFGADPNVSYFSRGSVYQSGTADFDGDFMTLMVGETMRAVVDMNELWSEALSSARKKMEKEKGAIDKSAEDVKTEADEYKSVGDDVVQSFYDRAAIATNVMAQTNTQDASIVNVNKKNKEEIMRAAEMAIRNSESYNAASSIKEEHLAEISQFDQAWTKEIGKSFAPVLSKMTGAVQNNDYDYATLLAEGRAMPTIYDTNGMMSILTANAERSQGKGNYTNLEAFFGALQNQLGKGNNSAQAQYLQKWYGVMEQLYTGRAAYVSNEDVAELEALMSRYNDEMSDSENTDELSKWRKYSESLAILKKRGLTEANLGLSENGQYILDHGYHSTAWSTDEANPEYQAERQRLYEMEERRKALGIKNDPNTSINKRATTTKFSITDLGNFIRDPNKFVAQLQGILPADEKTTESEFGTIMHNAMEAWGNKRIESQNKNEAGSDSAKQAAVDAGLAKFDELISQARKDHPELFNSSRDDLIKTGRERLIESMGMLQDYKVIATEQRHKNAWDLPSDVDQATAATDVVLQNKDGQIMRLDYKSNGAHNPLQAILYAALNDRSNKGTYEGSFGKTLRTVLLGGEGLNEDGTSKTSTTGYLNFNLKNPDGGIKIDTQAYTAEQGAKALAYYNEVAKILNVVTEQIKEGKAVDYSSVRAALAKETAKYEGIEGLNDDEEEEAPAESTPPSQASKRKNKGSSRKQKRKNKRSDGDNPPSDQSGPGSYDGLPVHVIQDRYNRAMEESYSFIERMNKEQNKNLDDEAKKISRFSHYDYELEQFKTNYKGLKEQVSEKDYKDLETQYLNAKLANKQALNHAISGDFIAASNFLDNSVLGNVNARNRSSLLEAVTNSVQQAGLSFEYFSKKNGAKINGKEEWESSSDQAAYLKAVEKEKEMKEKREQFYKEYAESLDETTSDLFAKQNGTDVPLHKYGQAIKNFKDSVNKQYEDLEKLYKAGGISKDEYTTKKSAIDKLDSEQYAKLLSTEHDRQVDAELEKYANLRKLGFGKTAGRTGLYGQSLDRYEAQAKQLEQINAGLNEKVIGLQGISATDERYEQAQIDIKKYTKAIEENEAAIDKLTGTHAELSAGLNTVIAGVSRLTQQFGRRLFQQAINEAKRFVMEYNASMTEIQAITMKTNAEMQSIRTGVVNKAINLRASTSEVADVTSALYRQGLSDAEVDSQTDAIVKFATVAQIKTTTATKIITTALRNNLVGSAEEAMDALVALGDSAATTAEEISKAMQKCAASAKVAGVSYNELNSMITVMTSMTQLSGQQVGTALNTIFSRMRNVTMSGYSKEINGETTTLNNVEKALKIAGIEMRKGAGMDEFKSASEILLEVAQKWNSMTDVQKAAVTSNLAQTRSANMFNTLMEGLSEDNGETFAKYLGLSGNSSGITQSKYEIMIESINARLKELRSTFDSFVLALEDDGVLTGVIEIGTTILNGLKNVLTLGGKAIGTIGAITTAVVALGVAMAVVHSVSSPLSTLLGLLAGGAVVAGAGLLGSAIPSGSSSSRAAESSTKISELNTYVNNRNQQSDTIRKYLKESDVLANKYKDFSGSSKLSAKETKELEQNIKDLTTALPSLNKNLDTTTNTLERWRKIVSEAKKSAGDFDKATSDTALALADEWAMSNFGMEYSHKLNDLKKSRTYSSVEVFKNAANESYYGPQFGILNSSLGLIPEGSVGYNLEDAKKLGNILLNFKNKNFLEGSPDRESYISQVKTSLNEVLQLAPSGLNMSPYVSGDKSMAEMFIDDLDNGLKSFRGANSDDAIGNLFGYLLDSFGTDFVSGTHRSKLQDNWATLEKNFVDELIQEAVGVVATYTPGDKDVVTSALTNLTRNAIWDENGHFREGVSYDNLPD